MRLSSDFTDWWKNPILRSLSGKLKAMAWFSGSRMMEEGISTSEDRYSLNAYRSSEPDASFPLTMMFDSDGCRPIPDVIADVEASDIFS